MGGTKKDKRLATAPKATYLWALCSKVVREADDYTCRKCGRQWRDEPGGLDGAHCVGRTKGIVKYVYVNVLSLCKVPCHGWFDSLSGMDHNDWVCEQIGEEAYEELKIQARGLSHRKAADNRELVVKFKADVKFLESCRRFGDVGSLRQLLKEHENDLHT